MTTQEIRSRLQGVTGDDTQFTARCPAHPDQHNSLSGKSADDGDKTLLKCHAGCATEKIVSAMGLTMSDLFTNGKTARAQKEIVATYEYKSADGALKYQKLKYSDKSFTQRQPDGKGGWTYNRKGIPPTLYNLAAVIAADTVYIAEGEKDADTLVEMGLVGTTGENGAGPGKWRKEYSEMLRGKTVYILFDNDDIGRAFGIEIAEALTGKAGSAKLLDLKQAFSPLPEHGDISDMYKAAGADVTREALNALINATEEYQPSGKQTPSDESEKSSVKPPDYSDTGNAEIFEREHRNHAIWTRGSGWFHWTGTHFEQGDHRVVSLARELSGRMLDEALIQFSVAQKRVAAENAGEPEAKALSDAKAYLNHANATRRKPRLDAMLGLAQSGLWKEVAAFDPIPFELNTKAGIVDLKTEAMRPHAPSAMCSKITSVAPGNKGKKMWSDFLWLISNQDSGVIWFLQQVAGMTLIGRVYHEGIIIAHGGGRNGKSTFFNAYADSLGSYAGHIAVNTLTTDRANKGAALATLRGKRLILTGELEEHQRLSVAMLKALASTDVLVAEEKFRAPEEFKQSHTICLFTNHLPRIGSTDNGTWRRLLVVPFSAVINEKDAVQNYGEVLAKEAGPAILQWAIDGACDFIKNGCRLCIPDAVAMATEEYQTREDWLGNFIAECCISGDRVAGSDLYAAYRAWGERSGEYIRRSNDFAAAMETSGYRKMSSNGRNYWTGIKLDTAQYTAAQGFTWQSRG